MEPLPQISLSGDIEGDYVVLSRGPGDVLKIGPRNPAGRVKSLKRTCTACPAQWEGVLDDGRHLYARYRWGELSIGLGDRPDDAIRNSGSDKALLLDHVGYGLDGFMSFEELRSNLRGLLEFPDDLAVEGETESAHHAFA